MKKGNYLLFLFFVVFLLSARVVDAKAQDAANGERIFGSNRFETSISISRAGWNPGDTETAVIATGMDYADALSATTLAKKYNAPILLTWQDSIGDSLKDELKRLEIEKVFIVGGHSAISGNVETQLKQMDISYVRLSGKDRYATSVAVASEISGNSEIIVATGLDFPDTLSIAPFAAAKGIPILLTHPNMVSEDVENYIKSKSITKSYVIGGFRAVSEKTAEKFPAYERIEGKDRYATNVAVMERFKDEFDFEKLYLAIGTNFPDALSGSALAALTSSPVVLTRMEKLPTTKDFVSRYKDEVKDVYLLGGEGALPNFAAGNVAPPTIMDLSIVAYRKGVLVDRQMNILLKMSMIPADARKPQVEFTVSDPSVLAVDENGTVTGLNPGKATINAQVAGRIASVDIETRDKFLIVIDPGHGGKSSGAMPATREYEKREAVLNMQISEKLRDKLEDAGVDVVLTREGDEYVSLDGRAEIANSIGADLFISIHHDSNTSSSANGTSTYYNSYKPGLGVTEPYVYAIRSGPVYDRYMKKIGSVTGGGKYQYIDTYISGDNRYILLGYNNDTSWVPYEADYITIRDGNPSEAAKYSEELAQKVNAAIMSLGLNSRGVIQNDFAVNRLSNMTSILVEVGFISNLQEFKLISQDSFQEEVAEKITEAVVTFLENY